jgi:hypothetical protein
VSGSDLTHTEDLLWWLVNRGFTRHVIGPVDSPRVVVMYYDWGKYIDVAHVRGSHHAEVARVPTAASRNVYRPSLVVWEHCGTITDALTALKQLPPPDDPAAPTTAYAPTRTLSDVQEEGPHAALSVDPNESGQVQICLSNQSPPDRA